MLSYLNGAVGAIFSAVAFCLERLAANGAKLNVGCRIKLVIEGETLFVFQDNVAEVFATNAMGYGLRARPPVEKQAIAVYVVAADLCHEPLSLLELGCG